MKYDPINYLVGFDRPQKGGFKKKGISARRIGSSDTA
jgi:hypothetical protein